MRRDPDYRALAYEYEERARHNPKEALHLLSQARVYRLLALEREEKREAA